MLPELVLKAYADYSDRDMGFICPAADLSADCLQNMDHRGRHRSPWGLRPTPDPFIIFLLASSSKRID